ncbi:succinyl-CoA ligase [ADP-forming] beta chain [Geminocystis sp. NIES-3708]|uniref:ATP-grasp domain-containing protein n=1 Tax=Geminocystis sp. NIES-3708 TaxID=1615909 RepID=UPI0005FC6EE0|nr:ATP-grasp domain-containing protein [Geminocystis sp. NIES-3708]BAQ61478.1 succinyl-CoA ligase [ADP-forming] beta chain [Geminocystis sp. NIES-3708]
MDLLEYQAKQLFEQVDIPILPSQSISDPSELKNLHIPYPIVLKSQVLASGRAKAGGVKFVENTIDAIAAAQSIFNLPIEGEYPEVILAEARYDAENEFFLAIMLDYALKRPVLLGSSHGGINIEILLDNLQTCVIEEEFSPFYARRLVKQMGLTGKAIASVSKIIEKMYDLFLTHDLDIIEINPLAINANGEVMALDGKIRLNDYALNRHPNLLKSLTRETHQASSTTNQYHHYNSIAKEVNKPILTLDFDSNLAIISDAIDTTIFTVNFLIFKEQKINSCYLLLNENIKNKKEQVDELFSSILDNSNIDVVLINVSCWSDIIDLLIQKIEQYFQKQTPISAIRSEDRADRATGVRFFQTESSWKKKSSQPIRQIHWILRVSTSDILISPEKLNGLPIHYINELENTIALTIKYSQLALKQKDLS